MNNKKDVDEQIEYTLSNFDFGKVEEVMKLLNWEWVNVGVPNQYHLIKRSEKLLRDTHYRASGDPTSRYSVATGGFEATCEITDGDIYFKLCFVLESWDNYE